VDNSIRLWHIGSSSFSYSLGKPLQGHRDTVYALAALPGGMLASGSADKTIRIWKNRRCIRVLRCHDESVLALAALSPPNPKATSTQYRLVSASEDGAVRLWDEKEPEPIGRGDIEGGVNCLTVMLTRSRIVVAIGSDTGMVHFVRVNFDDDDDESASDCDGDGDEGGGHGDGADDGGHGDGADDNTGKEGEHMGAKSDHNAHT